MFDEMVSLASGPSSYGPSTSSLRARFVRPVTQRDQGAPHPPSTTSIHGNPALPGQGFWHPRTNDFQSPTSAQLRFKEQPPVPGVRCKYPARGLCETIRTTALITQSRPDLGRTSGSAGDKSGTSEFSGRRGRTSGCIYQPSSTRAPKHQHSPLSDVWIPCHAPGLEVEGGRNGEPSSSFAMFESCGREGCSTLLQGNNESHTTLTYLMESSLGCWRTGNSAP